MVLADLVLPSRANQHWPHSGLDHPERCYNPQHFKAFPYTVDYQYNSRGFRDAEWPEQLDDVIWCVGDSFTVGLGSPCTHTWPWLLQHTLNKRTINVSMDGASNQWISRRTCDIMQHTPAKFIIIQWSYTHRRENWDMTQLLNHRWKKLYNDIKDHTWPNCPHWSQRYLLPTAIMQEIQNDRYWQELQIITDEHRRVDTPERAAVIDPKLNTNDFLDCLRRVQSKCQGQQIIHTFIPHWTNDLELQKATQPNGDLTTMAQCGPLHWVPEVTVLDYARDYHHYDINTAQQLVINIVDLLRL
jgi:hypothetical protein